MGDQLDYLKNIPPKIPPSLLDCTRVVWGSEPGHPLALGFGGNLPMTHVCGMCLQSFSSLCDSHIVPRAITADMSTPGSPLRTIDFTFSPSDPQAVKRLQRGIFDKIFCEGCEALTQRADDYFTRFHRSLVAGTTHFELTLTDDGSRTRRIRTHRADAELIQTFVVQTLFRAHLANVHGFKYFTLPTHAAEKMREALHAGASTLGNGWDTFLSFLGGMNAPAVTSPTHRTSPSMLVVMQVGRVSIATSIGQELPDGLRQCRISPGHTVIIHHTRRIEHGGNDLLQRKTRLCNKELAKQAAYSIKRLVRHPSD